jgi:hypothetical protein
MVLHSLCKFHLPRKPLPLVTPVISIFVLGDKLKMSVVVPVNAILDCTDTYIEGIFGGGSMRL